MTKLRKKATKKKVEPQEEEEDEIEIIHEKESNRENDDERKAAPSENQSPSKRTAPNKRIGYDLISGQQLRPTKKPKLNPETTATTAANDEESTLSLPEKNENKEGESGGTTCQICRNKAKSPFGARCGHICCYACWQQWLNEKLECPVCREKTRMKQLTKLYFV